MGSWQPAYAQREYHNNSTSGRGGPVIAFVSQVSDTRCQAVRERSVGP